MSELQSDTDQHHQWDYHCPQFCDLMATETEDQLRQIDNFFEVDHEGKCFESPEQPMSGPKQTPISVKKAITNSLAGDLEDGFTYETPPQNKENIEDNEVFYSTKKYMSVEKTYKLRSTPMRTLQYNGNTPLKETRLSSKKKKKNKKSMLMDPLPIQTEETAPESPFGMNQLLETLPPPVTGQAEEEPEAQLVIKRQSNAATTAVENQEDYLPDEPLQDDVFEKENEIPQPSSDCPEVVDRRLSYVIENRPQKTVTVVSPPKETKVKVSPKKSMASTRRTPLRKATPLRRSVTKVNTASVVARLYSTTKKADNSYKSMAELLKEFETHPRGTDRSRSVERTASMQRSRSSSVSSLTRPQSPKLHSVGRHRPTPRQTEDIILSQIKKYSFKANPIKKKLFDSKFASGIPRVKSTKVPTKAVELHFLTEKRHEVRASKHSTDEDGIKDKFQFKANPMPAFKAPLHVAKQSAKKATAFHPFSFDDRIREMMAKKRSLSEGARPQIKSVLNK